uniref:probable carboxylesterase 15 n=1 Tax=Erigeron canadensis TaxID=72917 RepID=UPI001CB9A490|nr:probable carboxylesterase 15 [Erigeron canadensis]
MKVSNSFAWPNFHNCCLRLLSGLHAIVVAPDYRLAPEHRLPTALENSYGGLKWIQTMAKGGDSSGGNIAHYLAVQLRPCPTELSPVRIRGYVMLTPFFGGTKRDQSELEGLTEKVLTLELFDM